MANDSDIDSKVDETLHNQGLESEEITRESRDELEGDMKE